jgi:hypothetical protein
MILIFLNKKSLKLGRRNTLRQYITYFPPKFIHYLWTIYMFVRIYFRFYGILEICILNLGAMMLMC